MFPFRNDLPVVHFCVPIGLIGDAIDEEEHASFPDRHQIMVPAGYCRQKLRHPDVSIRTPVIIRKAESGKLHVQLASSLCKSEGASTLMRSCLPESVDWPAIVLVVMTSRLSKCDSRRARSVLCYPDGSLTELCMLRYRRQPATPTRSRKMSASTGEAFRICELMTP
jgi:hypothetical protein